MSALATSPRPSAVTGGHIPLSVAELGALAHGDIFFRHGTEGRLVRLKRTGDYLDEQWRKKYGASDRLLIKPAIDRAAVSGVSQLWLAWTSAEDSAAASAAGAQLEEFLRGGLHSEGGLSLLTWAWACFEIFGAPTPLLEEMARRHELLQRRALHVAPLAVLFGLALGYRDPVFLRDLYWTSWWMDAGLLGDDFTDRVASACQHERQAPGSGLECLRQLNASVAETEFFLRHPEHGHERAYAEWASRMTHPVLLRAVERHHELAQGGGFPLGLHLSLIADWEALVVMADQMVGYDDAGLEAHGLEGMRECWRQFARRRHAGCPVARVWRRVAAWSWQQRGDG